MPVIVTPSDKFPQVNRESCYLCGNDLKRYGAEEKDFGVDRETGYHDIEVICTVCANERRGARQ